MTPKQMYRALRKYNISLIYDRNDRIWWAGDAEVSAPGPQGSVQAGSDESSIQVLLAVGRAGSKHCGTEPEEAVEDYCSARNLRWEV